MKLAWAVRQSGSAGVHMYVKWLLHGVIYLLIVAYLLMLVIMLTKDLSVLRLEGDVTTNDLPTLIQDAKSDRIREIEVQGNTFHVTRTDGEQYESRLEPRDTLDELMRGGGVDLGSQGVAVHMKEPSMGDRVDSASKVIYGAFALSLYVTSIIVSGMITAARGRGVWLGIALGILFSGLGLLVVVLLMKPAVRRNEPSQSPAGPRTEPDYVPSTRTTLGVAPRGHDYRRRV